jgi:transposase
MPKSFRPYNVDQRLLLPLDLRDWLPEGHLALFVSDIVDNLDLSAIFDAYEEGDGRGRPPYHPAMMVKLLVYGYCLGVKSSRKLERATYEDVGFRVLAGNQHPDHDSIAAFRKRHFPQLAALFTEVLRLCEKAGLVKLGHVAIDGTKVKANASKHKAMSYERMEETERRLREEVQRLLEEAERVDAQEDAHFGKGKRGDELPAELARRDSRLKKIAEAKAALEREAKEKAERHAEEQRAKLAERERKEQETGKKMGGRPPEVPDPEKAKPDPKAQRNFTDPESRIMLDGATKAFTQAYNAQLAVDKEAQIIVATFVTQAANDVAQLLPTLAEVQANMGRLPDVVTADAGYFSDANVTDPALASIGLYVPPAKETASAAKQTDAAASGSSSVNLYVPPAKEKTSVPMRTGIALSGSFSVGLYVPPAKASVPEQTDTATSASSPTKEMREKLVDPAGKAIYKLRKAIVEPVIGQIKQAQGFRGFSVRGLENVSAEWAFVCLTHNLLKLFRSGRAVLA